MPARNGHPRSADDTGAPARSQPPLRLLAERLRDAEWLDAVGDPARDAILRGLPDDQRALLRGRWLGHPLHPTLTDVPMGLWMSAVVLDFIGGERAEPAADRLLALGIATSVPTAAVGALDWAESSRPSRRQGLAHAAANVVALALFAGSALARRHDRRRGRQLSVAGTAALLAGGYLGGHLAYAEGVGVEPVAAAEPARAPTEPADA